MLLSLILRDTEMITQNQNVTLRNAYRNIKYKVEQIFNPGLMLTDLSGTESLVFKSVPGSQIVGNYIRRERKRHAKSWRGRKKEKGRERETVIIFFQPSSAHFWHV